MKKDKQKKHDAGVKTEKDVIRKGELKLSEVIRKAIKRLQANGRKK